MNLKANFNELKKAKTIKELVTILDYSLLVNASFIILIENLFLPTSTRAIKLFRAIQTKASVFQTM